MHPHRNSVHFPAINASVSLMKGNFMQKLMFFHASSKPGGASSKPGGGPVLKVPSRVGNRCLGCQARWGTSA